MTKTSKIAIVIVGVFIIFTVIGLFIPEREPTAQEIEAAQVEARAKEAEAIAESNLKQAQVRAQAKAEAEEKRKGFHCLSPWDGNHDGMEVLIKAQLKDPDSMETIETRMTPVDANGAHQVSLKYRARNSFGGMVVSQARGSVDNATCRATLLTVE